MTLDEIRACLAAPEAWERLLSTLLPRGDERARARFVAQRRAILAYCDERARNLAQILALGTAERGVQR